MENRCQRCNRELSDPDAVFGWRCAEILGVSGELSKMGADIFRKFVNGVKKVQKLFGNGDFEFTDENKALLKFLKKQRRIMDYFMFVLEKKK